MKVEIIKSEAGQSIGWTMAAEDKEEFNKLGTIRNLSFFGFEDSLVDYDGRSGSDDAAGDPGVLRWKQKMYIKKPEKVCGKK